MAAVCDYRGCGEVATVNLVFVPADGVTTPAAHYCADHATEVRYLFHVREVDTDGDTCEATTRRGLRCRRLRARDGRYCGPHKHLETS